MAPSEWTVAQDFDADLVQMLKEKVQGALLVYCTAKNFDTDHV